MILKVERVKHKDYANTDDVPKTENTEGGITYLTKCSSYQIRMYHPSKSGNKISREEIVLDSKDDVLWITDRDFDSVCREGIQISMVSFYDEIKKKVRLFVNFKQSKQLRIIEIKMLSGYIYYSVCYYLL